MGFAWTALIAGVVLFMPTAANAQGVPTRLHIRQVSGQRAYHGRVISPRRGCLEARRLRVYHDVSGGPTTVVAHATTDAKGAWRAAIPFDRYHPGDFYYARVAPMKLHGKTCVGAKSAYAQAIA